MLSSQRRTNGNDVVGAEHAGLSGVGWASCLQRGLAMKSHRWACRPWPDTLWSRGQSRTEEGTAHEGSHWTGPQVLDFCPSSTTLGSWGLNAIRATVCAKDTLRLTWPPLMYSAIVCTAHFITSFHGSLNCLVGGFITIIIFLCCL